MNETPAVWRPPPEGASKPDRETRIGFGALTSAVRPCSPDGERSPAGDVRSMRRGCLLGTLEN